MKFSSIKNHRIISPIEQTALVRPKAAPKSRSFAATLILTSLVDAFSILVIYLLFNSSVAQENIELNKDIQLPKATYSSLLKGGLGVQILKDGYLFDNKKVQGTELLESLEKVASDQQNTLIVQADESMGFEKISPLLVIASEAGYEKIKFATIGGEL